MPVVEERCTSLLRKRRLNLHSFENWHI